MGSRWSLRLGCVLRGEEGYELLLERCSPSVRLGRVERVHSRPVVIADLKARDDEGTVLVHGGPGFAASLTRLGLVDEYHLSTVPIAIGEGRSPFANLDEHLKLDVVEEQRFRSGALAQILVPRR